MVNIYVGNLPHTITDAELRETFEIFGEVRSAKIIKDKASGKSRGFAFVEMPNRSDALTAINELNGQTLGGRILTVNEARSREERSERQEESDPIIYDGGYDWDNDRRRRRDRRDRDRRDRDRNRHDREHEYEGKPRKRRDRRRSDDDDDDWGSY